MERIHLDLPATFPFHTELPVRISDINYGRHLGNDTMLAFLHEARLRFLARSGLSETDVGDCGLIMVDAVVLFKSQAFHGETLVVEVAPRDLSRCGCDFIYRVSEKASGREVARAKTGLVCFDYAKGKMTKAPDRFRAALGADPAAAETVS